MKKEEQTEAVKVKLYNMTVAFVRKHQPHYYKQYQGDPIDLAHEFYRQFLTAKSREKGKEETLLDKYDLSKKPANLSEDVFFANLVKVSVVRMLIDRSRADSHRISYIDKFVDEYGDVMLKNFCLTTEDEEQSIDNFEYTHDFIESVRCRFNNLTEDSRKAIANQYFEMRCALSDKFRVMMDAIIPVPEDTTVEEKNLYLILLVDGSEVECLCQQITPKTVCLLYGNDVYDFDRLSGACRSKKFQNMKLSVTALYEVKEYPIYKSKWSRKEIVKMAVL